MTERFIRYCFITEVENIEERFEQLNWRKVGGETLYDTVSLGWFLHLRESRESLYLGRERPNIRIGQKMRVTLETIDE